MAALSPWDIWHLSPDGLLVFRSVRDPDQTIVDVQWHYANPAAQGLTHSGVRLLDACQLETDSRRLLRWACAVDGGRPFSEDLHCTVEGREFVLQAQVTSSQEYLLVWLRDVTAERREAEALRQSQALLHAVIEGTTDAVFAKDLQGRYTLINSAGAEVLGRSPQEILGRTDLELFALPEALATVGNDRAVLASQCTLTYEDVETSGRAWLSTKGVVRNTEGALSGLFGICKDITARKQREEEQAREVELRERFMSILAHDLSSPIAAIRLSTQLLLAVGGLSPAQRTSLGRIEVSAERAMEMTRQLLDFAHIRYGKGLPVTLAPMNLEAVCHQVVAEFNATHPERPIQLELEGESWGNWDAHRVAQAVSNLIGNALEHGDGARPIRVRTWTEDGLQRLEVHNTGEPIARELMPSIFEPFRRGATTGQGRSGGGLGLGLYIVREIARALRGTVEVRSSAKEGTAFVLSMPREIPIKPQAQARNGRRRARLKLGQV